MFFLPSFLTVIISPLWKLRRRDHSSQHMPCWQSLSTTCARTHFKTNLGTSLVVQWLRICLPMQVTWVRALVQEDPTCCRATKPVHHNYWALEPTSHNYWSLGTQSPCSTTREATAMRSPCTVTKSSPSSPQLEKARAQQRRPNTAKNKLISSKKHSKPKLLYTEQSPASHAISIMCHLWHFVYQLLLYSLSSSCKSICLQR